MNKMIIRKIGDIPEAAKNIPVELIVRIPLNKRKKSKKVLKF